MPEWGRDYIIFRYTLFTQSTNSDHSLLFIESIAKIRNTMPPTKLSKTALTYALIILTLFVEPSCGSSMSCWKKWPNNSELKYLCNDYNQEFCDMCWKNQHRDHEIELIEIAKWEQLCSPWQRRKLSVSIN